MSSMVSNRQVFILAPLMTICTVAQVAAQQTFPLREDFQAATIDDKNGTAVTLFIPESLSNAQCRSRLFGTRPRLGDMFDSLYYPDRRTASYEQALRRLCMQPDLRPSSQRLRHKLESAGLAADEIQLVLDLVDKGTQAVNKRYVRGGLPVNDAANKLKGIARKLNKARKLPAFEAACAALAGVEGTLALGDAVVGAVLNNSLATDEASERLSWLRRLVARRQAQGYPVDPALLMAFEQAETNLRVARQKIGAFVIAINDRRQEIRAAAFELGLTLTEISLKVSGPLAGWLWAPALTFSTLQAISDQWELAQDAVSLATLTMLVAESGSFVDSQAHRRSCIAAGQAGAYELLAAALSTGQAKFRDMLSPERTNKEWSDYYGQRRREVLQGYHSDGLGDAARLLNSEPSRETPWLGAWQLAGGSEIVLFAPEERLLWWSHREIREGRYEIRRQGKSYLVRLLPHGSNDGEQLRMRFVNAEHIVCTPADAGQATSQSTRGKAAFRLTEQSPIARLVGRWRLVGERDWSFEFHQDSSDGFLLRDGRRRDYGIEDVHGNTLTIGMSGIIHADGTRGGGPDVVIRVDGDQLIWDNRNYERCPDGPRWENPFRPR
jgi:hypothetical protein